MPLLQRVVKPKTRKGKRFLESREPKLEEDVKRTIFVRGATSSNQVLQAAKDLNKLKHGNSIFFNKKNDMKPFEDPTSLEFFAQKNDSSLFTFISHNKKRPHNIVFGRMFDNHILDMMEFGLENFKAISEFKVPKIASGLKPMVVFLGEMFESDKTYQRIKNFFLDFFKGPKVDAVRLQGLEHVIQITAHEGKIYVRSFKVLLKKSGTKLPRVEVEEIGPRMDLILRRNKLASDNLFKLARKQPKQLKPKKVKNVKRNPLGSTMGRIHMVRQDYNRLQTRKLKGLRKTIAEKKEMKSKQLKPTVTSTNAITLKGGRSNVSGNRKKGSEVGRKRQRINQPKSVKRAKIE